MANKATRQTLDVGALILAADNARGSWDRADIVDYTHSIAHYLHQDGVVLTLAGKPINPSAMTTAQWQRMVWIKHLEADRLI